MKLIFHHQLVESDWFTFLLSEVVDEVVYDPGYAETDGPAIHVVSGNWLPIRGRSAFFEKCRANSDNLTLLHASDEWYSGGYSEYRHFDRIIRPMRTWLARAPGIFTIPVGYANGLAGPSELTPANQRKYLCSFEGAVKASRIRMVEALRDVEPSFIHDTSDGARLSREAYRGLMLDSVFMPCPMGNAAVETLRLYEALEFGCIPIVEKRWFIDYYHGLFGADPLLRVGSWSEAVPLMRDLVAAPDELLRLQQRTGNWWAEQKARTKRELTAFMRVPSRAVDLERYSQRTRNRVPALHEGLRLLELLRHQSAGSLAQRLASPHKILVRVRRNCVADEQPARKVEDSSGSAEQGVRSLSS
jgi:hypothetical protein